MADTSNHNHDTKPIVLVDGSSYLFRAYYAMPDLTSAEGAPTGAVRGVISMMRRLSADYPGSLLVVIFDAPGKTFRDALYSDYKANRESMPEDLREQIEPIHQIIKAMGLPLIMESGVEADDVIGTLAKQAEAASRSLVISTGDKDMAQLVSEHVTLVNTMTDTIMDTNAVVDKFGVTPAQIIDYLALMGDAVDNIPGVPKVGPKTAAKWLNQYETLEEVMENAADIGGKVGENLRTSLEQLPLSKKLTTIKCDVELKESLFELKSQNPDTTKLLQIFTKLGFKSWLEESPESGNQIQESSPKPVVEAKYETVLDEKLLVQWVKKLTNSKTFSFDTETTSLDYMEAELVGISFGIEPGIAAYIPIGHVEGEKQKNQLPLDKVLSEIKPLLESKDRVKVGQNLKYDINILSNYGINVSPPYVDTMLQSYVLNSVATRHNMDDMAQHYLGRDTIHFEDVAGKGAKQILFSEVSIDVAGEYAAEDADVTLQLHQELSGSIDEAPSLQHVLNEIEMPLVSVLAKVERNGALVDADMLLKQSKELGNRLTEIRDLVWSIAGEEFNLDSTKQLQEILYEKQGLPILKKTPGGKPSTAEPVLVDLARDYELPQAILEYRSLSKLKTTYADKLPLQINEKSGRIHTSYHQAVTATGRLSSTNPNLQNIPIKSEEGRRIRQAFVPNPGNKIVAADYSQIELRIMAHLSKDEQLCRAFHDGIDVHRATAAEVFGSPPEAVSDEERRSAKAINFGLIYGMSAFGLARQLGVSRAVAQNYIDVYFDRYPGVAEYMAYSRSSAREKGFVETVFGRRLYVPEIGAKHAQRRQAAERTAINAPMQGTAADVIKIAMCNVQKWLDDSDMDAQMIMQVHDELVFEVETSSVDELSSRVKELMEAAVGLDVLLEVEVGVGDNWDQAH
ncbi:MAG: DNA polymerase I [Candidatus Azotimanducaceae bacterium]